MRPLDQETVRAVGRYVLDRATQYRPTSGIHDALCTLGAAILTGDVDERHKFGELEDSDLIEWQDRILAARPGAQGSSLPINSGAPGANGPGKP